MKIKINAFLNIEFCVKQRRRQQRQKQWQAVFSTYANICPVSFSIEFSRFTWTTLDIFNRLRSRLFILFVLLLLLLLIKLWSRWARKNGATWRTRVMDTYCQLWFTICKWQLAPSAQAHSHTHFCYLKPILKYGRTTFTTVCIIHKMPSYIGDSEWNILF